MSRVVALGSYVSSAAGSALYPASDHCAHTLDPLLQALQSTIPGSISSDTPINRGSINVALDDPILGQDAHEDSSASRIGWVFSSSVVMHLLSMTCRRDARRLSRFAFKHFMSLIVILLLASNGDGRG